MGWGCMKRREDVRDAAVVMINLTEAKPGMVRKVDGVAGAIVRGCLEGMGKLADENMTGSRCTSDLLPSLRILTFTDSLPKTR